MGINEFFDAIAKVVEEPEKTEKGDVKEKKIYRDFPKTGMTAR